MRRLLSGLLLLLTVYAPLRLGASFDNAGEKVGVLCDAAEYSYSGYYGAFLASTYYAYDGDGRVINEHQGGYNDDLTAYGPNDYYTISDPTTYGSTAWSGLVANMSAGGTNFTTGYNNTYTYDKAGNRLTATYGAGVTGNRTLTSVYDAMNRLAVIEDTVGNTTYHYDLAGRRVGLLYPSSSNITTTFDAVGRQTAIVGSRTSGNVTTTPYTFNLTYDQYNNLGQQVETYQTVALGLSNRTVSLAYDAADRLTGEVLAVTNATTTTNITSNYTYDAAFNRSTKFTKQKIGAGGNTTEANITYHYNAGNELTYWFDDTHGNGTWVTPDTGANYTYDTAGNRITQSYKATMPEPSNITNAPYITTNTTYTYLQVGNDNFMTSANLVTGWWKSGSDKLQEVLEHSTFSYDDQARRLFEDRYDLDEFDSNVTHTGYGTVGGNYSGSSFSHTETAAVKLYDGEAPVRAYQAVQIFTSANSTWSNTGNLSLDTGEYIRGSDWGGGIGGILYSLPVPGNATNAKYYNYDGRGDVVALTSNIGNVTYGAAYDAYGKHATVTTSGVTTTGTQEVGTDTDPFRNNTKPEWDSADGTAFIDDDYRVRGLDTDTYLSRDPMGMVDGTNLYTHVLQNEWTKTDPRGLYPGESVVNYVGGAIIGAGEAASGISAGRPSSTAEYQGRNFGRNLVTGLSAVGMAHGIANINTGGGMMGAAALSEPATMGASTPAAAPTFLAGAVTTVAGTVETALSAKVMMNASSLPGLQKPATSDDPSASSQADKKGGAYKDLQDVGDGQDAHHMPSSEALKESGVSKSDGPAIKMDPDDHADTASWGNRADAQAYRAKQAELIKQGDFKGATQMDYDDLKSKFGDKYYEHIQQHQNYVESLPKEDLQPKSNP